MRSIKTERVSLSRAMAGMPAMAIVAMASLPGGAWAAPEEDRVYRASATYTGELWRNVSGGLRTESSYLDNLDIEVEVDGERAWGLEGLTVFAYGLYNNSHELSSRLTGDAQAVSNIEAAPHPFLYELWADWSFGRDAAHSLRVGLYDLNSEFDASEVASLFINSAHGIGPQFAQTGRNGPSIFPATSFGARLRWQPMEGWIVQLAALDAVAGDPRRPSRFRVGFGGEGGFLLVAELSRAFDSGARVAFGGWQYTAAFDDLLEVDESGAPARRRDNRGGYVLGEARLWSSEQRSSSTLDGYVRLGTAEGRINRFDGFVGTGLVAKGLFESRPEDRLGIGFTMPLNGRAYREQQRLQGIDTERAEYAIELTYRMEFGPLALQPVVQYIGNPDTRGDIQDALAIALRFSLTLER